VVGHLTDVLEERQEFIHRIEIGINEITHGCADDIFDDIIPITRGTTPSEEPDQAGICLG
jgi:hypothetical protein